MRQNILVFAALLLLPATAWAQDTVTLEIGSGDRVAATLRPATEVERFLIDVPAGAVVTVTAKAKGGPVPQLTVFTPDGAELLRGTARGNKSRLRTTVASSGIHVVRVEGDGVTDGDYTLKTKVKPIARIRVDSATDLAADTAVDIPFAAPAGALLNLTVGPIRGSGLVAADLVLVGPDGAIDVTAEPTKSGKLRVSGKLLSTTGDYVLRFRNDGAGGAWKARIRIVAGDAVRRRIDVTDAALKGAFGGTQAVFGARATPDSETVVVPAAGALNLSAMQVTVPVGAVTAPAVVSIVEVEPFFVDDATFSAGEAIRLEPAGTQFTADVQVTLPFLAQSFDDPLTDLIVVRRDEETGEIEELPGPFAVDVDAGTVTFPTSEFSSFQTVSRQDRPVKGTFLEVVIRPRLLDDGGELTLATNLVHGDFGERTVNPADRTRVAHTLTWSAGAGVGLFTDEGSEIGTFAITSDDEIELATPSSSRTYRRGRTANALVAGGTEAGAPRLGVLLRRTQGTPTRGALAGEWHVFVLEGNAIERGAGAVTTRLLVQRVTLSVAADGTTRARGVVRQIVVRDLPDAEWRILRDRATPRDGTLLPAAATGDAAFGAVLDMELGLARFLTRVELFPALSGDVLIGTASAEEGAAAAVRLVILVRLSSNAANSVLAGSSLLAATGFRIGGLSGAELADAATSLDVSVRRSTKGAVTAEGTIIRQNRGMSPTGLPAFFEGTWKLDPTGALRESQPLRNGALTPRGEFYVDTDVRDGRIEIGFGLPSADR